MPDRYRLKLSGPAARALEKTPARAAAALADFMSGRLLDNPWRIGKRLRAPLDGFHAARVHDYRIRYRIDESARLVTVVHVAARSDAYRPS